VARVGHDGGENLTSGVLAIVLAQLPSSGRGSADAIACATKGSSPRSMPEGSPIGRRAPPPAKRALAG
jgi:hypothetical protein